MCYFSSTKTDSSPLEVSSATELDWEVMQYLKLEKLRHTIYGPSETIYRVY